MKNIGYLRVDVRNPAVNMQVHIRHPESGDKKGECYFIVQAEKVYGILIGECIVRDGQCKEQLRCSYQGINNSPFSMDDVIGVGIRFDNDTYASSSWQDEADEVVALGNFAVYGSKEEIFVCEDIRKMEQEVNETENTLQKIKDEKPEHITELEKNPIEGYEENKQTTDFQMCEGEFENNTSYKKINLNEIYTLPSRYWHYSNNSFLIHGFWNYGYLVLKEDLEEDKTKLSLGIPGIFEQPEMVMATFFGFPYFEELPSEVAELVMGEGYVVFEQKNNQQPKTGTFGCWFVNL